MGNIIVICVAIYAYFFMKKVLDSTPKDCELTKNERINVFLTLLFGTLPAWLIYYLGWKNKLPTKVKQVNLYIRNIIIGLVILGVIAMLIAFLLVGINPNRQIRRHNSIITPTVLK